MKKIITLILSVVLLISVSVTTFAAETNDTTGNDEVSITANVPSTHKIKVETDGKGAVYLNGKAVENINADRLSTPNILICPESGYIIANIMLDDEDITSKIKGGFYTFDAVYKDSILKVNFKKSENGSFKYSLVGTVTKNNVPSENVLLELSSGQKTYTTGKDGKFGFKDIAEGYHTLAAIVDGKIVGYVEFYLTRSDKTKNVEIKKNENGTFDVLINKNFEILELDFNITDEGKIEIKDGKATNKPEDVKDYPNAPQTGYNSKEVTYLIMSFCTMGIVFIITIRSKRRKKTNKIQ